MVKMGKHIGWLLAASMIVLPVSIQSPEMVWAEQTTDYQAVLVDEADLFTDEEEDVLKQAAEVLSNDAKWNVIITTTDDAKDRSAQTVAEDLYNEYTSGDNGISCLIDMDNREMWIATAGDSQYYLNDQRIDSILDDAYEEISDGKYAACMQAMITGAQNAYNKGIPDNARIYNEDTGEVTVMHKIMLSDFLLALGIALGAGAAVYAGIVGKYRLKWGTYHYDFHQSSKLQLSKEKDQFINEVVTHHHIQKNDGNGSGGHGGHTSTVHSGSGGRSFGGGGRSF